MTRTPLCSVSERPRCILEWRRSYRQKREYEPSMPPQNKPGLSGHSYRGRASTTLGISLGRERRETVSESQQLLYLQEQNDLILILGFRSEKKGTQWVRPDRGLEAQTPGVPMEEGAGRKMPMFLLDSGSASPTQDRRDQPLRLQTQFLSLGVRWVQTCPFSASYKKCWRPRTEGSLTNPS